jgi:hypothetical protein
MHHDGGGVDVGVSVIHGLVVSMSQCSIAAVAGSMSGTSRPPELEAIPVGGGRAGLAWRRGHPELRPVGLIE